MLWRYISHIPSRHFKMVRYYGFLANRKRGPLLPKVWFKMKPRAKLQKLGFAVLMKTFLGTNPYQCILCKGRLLFSGVGAGKAPIQTPDRFMQANNIFSIGVAKTGFLTMNVALLQCSPHRSATLTNSIDS